jgi:exonuclease VII large subunit
MNDETRKEIQEIERQKRTKQTAIDQKQMKINQLDTDILAQTLKSDQRNLEIQDLKAKIARQRQETEELEKLKTKLIFRKAKKEEQKIQKLHKANEKHQFEEICLREYAKLFKFEIKVLNGLCMFDFPKNEFLLLEIKAEIKIVDSSQKVGEFESLADLLKKFYQKINN